MRFSAHITDGGTLKVTEESAWRQALDKRAGKRVWVDLLTWAQIRSSQQNRYWFGCVVKFIAEQWHREGRRFTTSTGVEVPLPKGVVHDALVTAFGSGFAETPLGRSRRSTKDYTMEEFSALIDETAAYVLDTYKVPLPSPEEWRAAA